MSTPEDPDYRWAHAQVDEILHLHNDTGNRGRTYQEPAFSFNYVKFAERVRERWNSLSVAEQHFYKMVGSVFTGTGITGVLVLAGMRENDLTVVPGVAGWALAFYYSRKVRQAIEQQQ